MNWTVVGKYKWLFAVLGFLAAVAGSFLLGRYTGPTKTVIKVETQIVEKEVIKVETQYVDKIVYVKTEARDVHTQVVVVKQPDGTETTTTVVDDKTKTNEASTQQTTMASSTQVIDDKSTTEVTSKTIESVRPDWHMALRVGGGLTLPLQPLLSAGLSAERRIVGPFWVGLWADVQLGVVPTVTPRGFTAGLSVGLEF